MNPTAVAEQQRQQEVEALREEVIRLRELHSQDDSSMHNPSRGFSLPPSKEVQGQKQQQQRHTGHTRLCKSDFTLVKPLEGGLAAQMFHNV